jgi:MFS family permease
VVAALGITWILDGLEVTLVGAVAGAPQAKPCSPIHKHRYRLASSAYLAGAVLGALFFGWLTDRIGRKKLFFDQPHRLSPWPRRPRRSPGISGALWFSAS